MHIILLTHQREQFKKTNTGQLIQVQPGLDVTRIIWERTNPDQALLKMIAQGDVFLLYPDISICNPTVTVPVYLRPYMQDNTAKKRFIIIDSTWQEARKIFNRSPYLKDLPRITLAPSQTSLFKLRRNQIAGGLCTAESVIALLKMNHKNHLANKLETDFYTFISHVSDEFEK